MAFIKQTISFPPRMAKRIDKERGAQPFSTHVQQCIDAYWDCMDLAKESVLRKLQAAEIDTLIALSFYQLMNGRLDPGKIRPTEGMKGLIEKVKMAPVFEDNAGKNFEAEFGKLSEQLIPVLLGFSQVESIWLWNELRAFWLKFESYLADTEENFSDLNNLFHKNKEVSAYHKRVFRDTVEVDDLVPF